MSALISEEPLDPRAVGPAEGKPHDPVIWGLKLLQKKKGGLAWHNIDGMNCEQRDNTQARTSYMHNPTSVQPSGNAVPR